jgi:hypothetical protein
MTARRRYARELAGAGGQGLHAFGMVACAVAGFAAPWLLVEWLASREHRRWQAEYQQSLINSFKPLGTSSAPTSEPAKRRRRWL